MQGTRDEKDIQEERDSSLVPAVAEACKGDGRWKGDWDVIAGYIGTVLYWPTNPCRHARLGVTIAGSEISSEPQSEGRLRRWHNIPGIDGYYLSKGESYCRSF